MSDAIPRMPPFEPGWVWLTGAGPGDPGLLTLLAYHALRQADVVVYDALVSPEILALASPSAEQVYAGKRGGKPSARQRDISHRLIALARSGKRVLRLKGGDPFVFGRGGEEGLALVAAGVNFRIVPGISAGIGGLAYAGIPLTHRDTNSAVTFVTGHNASGAVPDTVDWAALARGSNVLVVYMPLKHIDRISRMLIEGGRDPEEPCAIVVKATTTAQRVYDATLSTVAAGAASAGLEPPAMLVVGEVVRLRRGLDWLGALAGATLETDPLGAKRFDESA